jgi:hypothetical protein
LPLRTSAPSSKIELYLSHNERSVDNEKINWRSFCLISINCV